MKHFFWALCTLPLLAACSKTPSDVLETTFKGMRAEYRCFGKGEAARCFYVVQPPEKPTAMVIALHPAFHNVAMTESLSKFAPVAMKAGVLLVYPEGVDKQWNDGRYAEKAETFRLKTDDVGFITRVAQEMQREFHISLENTTLAGMSNGGMMSQRLACETDIAGRMITAVANLPVGLEKTCTPKLKHAVFVFGTEDDVVHYAGGALAEVATDWGAVISARATEELFAQAMQCSRPQETYMLDEAEDGTRLERTDYVCPKGVSLSSNHIHGMGHTWPGEENRFRAWITSRGRISHEISMNLAVLQLALTKQ